MTDILAIHRKIRLKMAAVLILVGSKFTNFHVVVPKSLSLLASLTE